MTNGCHVEDRGGIITRIVMMTALVVGAGCNSQSVSPVPFPVSNEVTGWVKVGNTRTFQASDLWKYIDGEAERYLKAGALRVSTADYKFREKVDTVVDVYTMANPESAAKILDSEPAGDAEQIQLGDSARLYGQSLVFRQGPYLVRIVAYEESAQISRAITELGRSIQSRLTR